MTWGLLVAAAGASAGCAQAAPGPPGAADEGAATPAPADGERLRWLVTFTEPAVAARFAGSADTGTEGTRQDRMRAYAAALDEARQARLAAIRSLGAVVLGTMAYSTNAALIEVPASRAATLGEVLRRLPGVSSVQASGVYRADGEQAPPNPGR